jgi:hypothetical protein
LLAWGGRGLALGIHDETINKLKGVDKIRTVLRKSLKADGKW